MNKLNRRKFLTMAGVGSAAAASAVLPGAGLLTGTGAGKNGVYTFRAVVGLPKKPLPAYASYVIEGQGDVLRITGVVDDRSQLQRGESPTTQILVDRSRGIVQAGFLGNPVLLNLEK